MKNYAWLLLLPWILLACGPEKEVDSPAAVLKKIDQLKKLDEALPPTQPGDWLARFHEDGQTFAEYQAVAPVRPTVTRKTIYLLPVGDFTPMEMKLATFTARYVERFFGLKTILTAAIPDSLIPAHARRTAFKTQQLHSLYILDSLLLPRIPADCIALMALTAKDLYPGPQWNYVFGQANLRKRVGVTSLYRLHDWQLSETNYHFCLRRLIRTASHEIGHMFSITHCTRARCLMNGANSLEEADRNPNHPCGECLKKLYWNLGFDPRKRNAELIRFFEVHQMPEELPYYQWATGVLAD